MITTAQRLALSNLPNWIGVGVPASVVGVKPAVLKRMCNNGMAIREKPNEEWPYIYARTGYGLFLLNEAEGRVK